MASYQATTNEPPGTMLPNGHVVTVQEYQNAGGNIQGQVFAAPASVDWKSYLVPLAVIAGVYFLGKAR